MVWRVARRGGNYNNTSNAGLGYLNGNNTRSNANVNNGARPRSQAVYYHPCVPQDYGSAGLYFMFGRGTFPVCRPADKQKSPGTIPGESP